MTPTILTFAQFEKLPNAPGKQELLNGELILLPPASERHSQIVHRIFRLLDQGGRARMETGYQLNEATCVQPDVSLPWPEQTAGVYLEGGPMLAVEVISPANSADAMQRKLALYFDNGTLEVWLVYPATRTIEVHYRWQSSKFSQAFSSESAGRTVDPAEIFGC